MKEKINFLEELNNKQKTAVLNTEGPTLVVAGAGSGKTKVLTSKLAYIVEQKKAWPNQILCVTFTNKAAKEMRDRVNRMLSGKINSLSWLGTFHAISVKFLRRHAEAVGLKSNFTILDTDDQKKLVRNISKAENIDAKKISPQFILAFIDQWKNKGLLPEEVKLSKKNLNLTRQEVRVWLKHVSPKLSVSFGKEYNDWFRKKSAFEMQKIFLNRKLRINYEYSDKLFRLDGMVWTGDANLNIWLVKNGWSFYLLENGLPIEHEEFLAAENEAKIKKIGLSIYDFEKAIKILKKFKFDIIQCPYNVIDRRLDKKNYINFFKKKKIEIHVRSIFLQGLLLMKNRPKKFKKWIKIFDLWDQVIKRGNFKPESHAINFVLKNKIINKIVIGFENSHQLMKVFMNYKKLNCNYSNKIKSNDLNLINPNNWNSL